MKFWNAKRVTISAAVVLAVGAAGCARQEVVASEPAMTTPRMVEATPAPVMTDTPAATMAQSPSPMPATTPMDTPMATAGNTYSSSSADASRSGTSMDRSTIDEPAPRVDRN